MKLNKVINILYKKVEFIKFKTCCNWKMEKSTNIN